MRFPRSMSRLHFPRFFPAAKKSPQPQISTRKRSPPPPPPFASPPKKKEPLFFADQRQRARPTLVCWANFSSKLWIAAAATVVGPAVVSWKFHPPHQSTSGLQDCISKIIAHLFDFVVEHRHRTLRQNSMRETATGKCNDAPRELVLRAFGFFHSIVFSPGRIPGHSYLQIQESATFRPAVA